MSWLNLFRFSSPKADTIELENQKAQNRRIFNEFEAEAYAQEYKRTCPHIGSPCIQSKCKYWAPFQRNDTSRGTAPLIEIPCKNWRDAHPEYAGGFKLV